MIIFGIRQYAFKSNVYRQLMSLTILDLPEEILDSITGALLPLHGPHELLHVAHEYEPPIDLLHTRLACRRLYWLTSRWLSLRVHLELSRKTQGTQVNGIYFAHPEQAINTQVLHISGFLEAHKLAISFPRPIFFEMRNLRVLILQVSGPIFAAEVLPQLLSQPFLHTLILEGSEETTNESINWSHVRSPFSNLKRLGFGRIRDIGHITSLSPSVEALSIRPAARLDDILNRITFPWQSLRHLTLEDVLDFGKTCMALSESYQSVESNADDPKIETLLSGLMVNQNLTNTDAHTLLTTFCNQTLHSLLLGCVVKLDIPFLERVVSTFPKLREFALLKISAEAYISNVELNQYTTVLGRLRELQTLHLNCIRHHDSGDPWLRIQLDRILVPIATHCPKLVSLRFMHQGDGVSTLGAIIRNAEGEYKGHTYETFHDGCRFSPSVWNLGDHFFI
ncbi:hypothetical protein K439DRAFT_1663181 [Ramaria rubella]|nr:hypothetical protein K439DRAFT_1663181 [Ramaria rubella]